MTNNSNVAGLRRAPYRLKQAMCLMTIAAATLTLSITATVTQAQGIGPGFHVSATGDQNCPGGQTLSLATPPALL